MIHIHTHTVGVATNVDAHIPNPRSGGWNRSSSSAAGKTGPKEEALPAGPPAGREAVVKKRCEINGRRTKKQNLALISEHTIYLVRTHTHTHTNGRALHVWLGRARELR